MTTTPYGCAVCGDAQHHHGTQWHPTAGLHQWQQPTDAQIKERMSARRADAEAGKDTRGGSQPSPGESTPPTGPRFDPPAPALLRGREQWPQTADALRSRPGQWALIGKSSSSGTARQAAYEIRTGKRTAFRPAGAYEVEARTMLGEHRVYARYTGAGGDAR